MNIRRLGGAALLGLTALLAGSAAAQASDRYEYDGGRRGYYSRGSHSYGRSYRSYRYGYRAPRRSYSFRHYYSGRPYYDYDYGYDSYYWAPPPAYYYGPRYCRPRSRVGIFFGW